MLGQNPREAPDLVKRIVKRRRREMDDVWFPEIAFCALRLLYSIDSSIF
jgi:hypothetical protein